jgi:REP element-mobilizing transposase RayT
MSFQSKKLFHDVPAWVPDGSEFFITVCAQSRGGNPLCEPGIAQGIYDSLMFRQQQQELWVYLLLVMPDHLHLIAGFASQTGMRKSMANWKRYTARQWGISWQCDFFDHRLRGDDSYIEKAHYIRLNPVRAGLVDRAENWPYVWEGKRTDFN